MYIICYGVIGKIQKRVILQNKRFINNIFYLDCHFENY